MSHSLSRAAASIGISLIITACSTAAGPSPSATTTPAPAVVGSTPVATPASATPALTPTASLVKAVASLLVRGDARAIGQRIGLAPGSDGTVFVSIPRRDGAVLALLESGGGVRPGWPIGIENATSCGHPMPVLDGSVRILCDATDLPRSDDGPSDVRAFAFDVRGRLMPGWPVRLRPGSVARVVARDLVLVESEVTGVLATGDLSYEVWLTTVSADGIVRSGTRASMVGPCCGGSWTIGPDGVAYGIERVGEWLEEGDETSRIVALEADGVPDGWPAEFDGKGSDAGFGLDGRPLVATGPFASGSSRVLAFGTDGTGARASGDLPIHVARGVGQGDVDCAPYRPLPPLTSDDGTIFVISELDDRVLALDAGLGVKRGWPFRADTPIVRSYFAPPGSELTCSTFISPVAGPTGVLFLSLQAPSETVGGRLVAVGPDGRVRPGWPVRLTRPGAEFWSVVVGSDGTVYALALEPETAESSSASLLAIAPDSTILSITTIVEP